MAFREKGLTTAHGQQARESSRTSLWGIDIHARSVPGPHPRLLPVAQLFCQTGQHDLMRQFQPLEKADIVEFRVKVIHGVRWTYKDPSSASHCCCQQVVLGDNGSSMR